MIYKGVKIPDLKPSCERNTNRRRKKKEINTATASKIAEMHNDGRTYKEIAAECGISTTTARRTIDNLRRCEAAPSDDFKTAGREAKED